MGLGGEWMIHIFIYHSQLERLQFLQKVFAAYFEKEQHTYHLTTCGNYDDAVSRLKGSAKDADIFFLDFSDYQKAIRLTGFLWEKNFRASWVYVDGTADHLYQALIMRPSACLFDSGNAKDALIVLKRLEQYHQRLQKEHYFTFKCEGEYVRIPFEEISYFESSAKKVMLRQSKSDKAYCFTAKLDEIAGQLPPQFLRCHQSFLVNMQMVRRLDTQNHVFLLHSNEEILISRRCYQQAREQYEQFLEKKV